MCLECGCDRPEPFGVKVLRAIAPRLLQPKSAANAGGVTGSATFPTSEAGGVTPPRAGSGDGIPRCEVTPPTAMADPAAVLGGLGCRAGSPDPAAAGASIPGGSGDPGLQHTSPRIVEIHESLLADNDAAAARNRAVFASRRLLALNLVSSPGAGKTTLLSRTVDEFGHEHRCAVVVGDLETDNDARRIHRPHVPVAQITTGTACHLDAEMVARGVDALELDGVRVLFIENVGNLVCPASFDLGEAVRVVLLSATEGEDKPLKYPPIFKSAHLVLLTKVEIAAAVGFDCGVAVANIRRVAPQARLIQLSARTGEGMDEWYQYLRDRIPPR